MIQAGLLLATLPAVVLGQATHTVSVGIFYNPPTVDALQNDVVEFIFTAGTHSVTQGDFADPCQQLDGGFNSGFVTGFTSNSTLDSPTWSLTITNATEPIFFYCQAMIPSFHCENGMVGAINAPNDMFLSYSTSAKLLSGTPTQTTIPVLTGVAGFASVLPTTLTPSITPAPTSSAFPAPTASQSTSSNLNKGAVIGGVVGGTAGVCFIAILAYLLYRAKRKASEAPSLTPEITQRFDNDRSGFISPHGTDGSKVNEINREQLRAPIPTQFDPAQLYRQGYPDTMISPNTIRHEQSIGSLGSNSALIRSTHKAPSTISDPTLQDPPISPAQPEQRFMSFLPLSDDRSNTATRGAYYPSDATNHSVTNPTARTQNPEQMNNVDVHEIAKEVASILGPQLHHANSGTFSPRSNQPRPLPTPDPRQYPEVPKSPGPPQYERYS